MKIKIQSILASLLAVSLLTCSASAMAFPDVPKDSDYATAIEYISELKIMVGDTAGNFNPNNVVNRAEMATIICRMLGKTENLTTSNVFDDVPTTHWANAYIGQAAALGIVGGYGNGKFGPGDPVTYEQAVTMIVRTIGKEETALTYGGYPLGHLRVAEENSLLKGIQAQQGQGLSRGLVAVLLYNYYTTLNNTATPNDGHIHNYIEKTVPGTGHYEQIITGYKSEPIYETRRVHECARCGAVFNSSYELQTHQGFGANEHFDFSNPCLGARSFYYDKKVQVGENQVPVYENKWVVDTPDTTVRICSVCGYQE